MIFASVITFFLLILSSDVVWSVRVEGCKENEKTKILSDLASSGLHVGSLWHKTDLSKVETETLLKSEELAWISINRRGTVAYVSTVPKTVSDSQNKGEVYSNVVAAVDCVIEKITVKSGIALVKDGESVKRGDVLISGVIPTELGGGFCYADGDVIGRYYDSVSVFAPVEIAEKVYSEAHMCGIVLDFFGKDINIFKKYRNFPDSCDIIEKNTQFSLFGAVLPVSFRMLECQEYTEIKRSRDSGELVSICQAELSSLIVKKTADKELLSVRCNGEFYDDGYRMTADMTVRGEIAKTLEFYRE